MFEFFKEFATIEKVYFILAIVATVFLVVQIILMLCSFDSDFDVDGGIDIDGDFDVDSGVSLFTTKSLTSFFAIGGWAGLASYSGVGAIISIIIAVAAGSLAGVIVWLLLRGIQKLQSEGNIDIKNAVGMQATVYVGILPNREGKGKVTLSLQGKFVEYDAITDEKNKLEVDMLVDIIEANDDCLVVKKSNL